MKSNPSQGEQEDKKEQGENKTEEPQNNNCSDVETKNAASEKEKAREANEWHDIGSFLIDTEKYDEAVECFDKILEVFPDDQRAWFKKSVIYKKMGREDELKECMERIKGLSGDQK